MNVNKLILIVDDDHVYKLVTRRMISLCCTDTDVISVENGSEAFRMLQSAIRDSAVPIPDVILLDIEMPEMNGWEFLNAFSMLPPAKFGHIRIYVVSSSIDQVDKERTSIYPAVKELLVKPFSVSQLDSILNADY